MLPSMAIRAMGECGRRDVRQADAIRWRDAAVSSSLDHRGCARLGRLAMKASRSPGDDPAVQTAGADETGCPSHHRSFSFVQLGVGAGLSGRGRMGGLLSDHHCPFTWSQWEVKPHLSGVARIVSFSRCRLFWCGPKRERERELACSKMGDVFSLVRTSGHGPPFVLGRALARPAARSGRIRLECVSKSIGLCAGLLARARKKGVRRATFQRAVCHDTTTDPMPLKATRGRGGVRNSAMHRSPIDVWHGAWRA